MKQKQKVQKKKKHSMHQRNNSGSRPIPTFSQISNKFSEWASAMTGGGGGNSSSPTPTPTFDDIKETSLADELGEMSELTMTQRLSGFFMSLGMGVTFIIIAISFVPTLALFPKKFAFFYSCGSLFCVMSTAFLVGFKKQVTMMFEQHRSQAAAAYVVSLFMTLISAAQWQSTVLSIAFASIQIVAVLWYSLSFIPFARQVVGQFLGYFWIVAKPILSLIGSLLGTCLGWLCRSSSSSSGSSASTSAI